MAAFVVAAGLAQLDDQVIEFGVLEDWRDVAVPA